MSARGLSNVSLFVTPELSQFLSIDQQDTVTVFPAGGLASITARVAIPGSASLGTYEGTIHVRSGSATVPNTLKVLIHVVPPVAGVVPHSPAFPSPDQITTTESGVEVVADEVLVSLQFDLPNPDQIAIPLATGTGGVIIGSVPDLAIFQFRYAVADLTALDQIRATLQASQYVEFAVFHSLSSITTTATPNDPRFLDGSQWGLNYINAPAAWGLQTGSPSVIIGIIDRDFDPGHPDLRANITTPLLPPPANPFNSGHGTHVAGISGAVGNNGIGIAGTMWTVSERLYDCAGPGIKDIDGLCVAGSMAAAAQDGARIVNLSSSDPGADCGGNPPPDQNTLASAISSAQLTEKSMRYAAKVGKDVLWVFSAGNGCRDASYESGPQAASTFPTNTLVVAAVARTGQLWYKSNFGNIVDVAAPGEEILSTVPRLCPFGIEQLCFASPGWNLDLYGTLSGTSQAAPFVSGLAGLVLSQHPTFSSAQIKKCIVNAAQSAGSSVSGQPFHIVTAPEAVSCSSPAASTAYVTQLGPNSDGTYQISRFDVETNQVLPPIAATTGSLGAALSSDMSKFAVGFSSMLGIFDAVTGASLSQLTSVASTGFSITTATNGGQEYWAVPNAGAVSFVSVASPQVTYNVDVRERCGALSASCSDPNISLGTAVAASRSIDGKKLFVGLRSGATGVPDFVSIVDLGSVPPVKTTDVIALANPDGITGGITSLVSSPDGGKLFVTLVSSRTGSLAAVDLQTHITSLLDTGGCSLGCGSFASFLLQDGRLVVSSDSLANPGTGSIEFFDPSSSQRLQTLIIGPSLQLSGIAEGTGRLYITDTYANPGTVIVLDLATSTVLTRIPVGPTHGPGVIQPGPMSILIR
jgi:thermitase